MGLLSVGVSLTSSLALFARIFEYLDLPVEVDDPATRSTVDPDPGRRVTCASRTSRFSYPGTDTAAVDRRQPRRARPARRWPWSARPGPARARSPRSSPGSTTRRPAASRIDGIDLRDLRLADLAAIVGVVSQETYLLHTTVRENLRYAQPDATDAEIEAPPAPRRSTT